MRLLWRTLVNAAAIWVTAIVVPGIHWGVGYAPGSLDAYIRLALAGLVLGLVNAFVRPIFVLLSMPITCATLGIFLLVVNALMLMLASALSDAFALGFKVDGFLDAVIGSIVISLVSFFLSRVIPD